MTRILIVDDDPDIRLAVTMLLLDAGYEVDSATNGLEAFAAIRERRPDAVLLDLTMAVMDGWDFLGAIRADPTLRGVPIGVLSASRDAAKAEQEPAVWAVIPKPFSADYLLSTVEALVKHSIVRRGATTPR
ncbi:MAG TPA: response regulator [Chloroflexota bacterium]|nr:response regulator [Chloroflexota bacterium]